MEQFVLAAKSLIAAQEREHISTRVKAGLDAAKARGVKLGRPAGHHSNKGYRKVYSRGVIDKICQLRSGKTSFRTIASVLDMCEGTVRYIHRRHGDD